MTAGDGTAGGRWDRPSALTLGVRDAIGAPVVVLMASFFGFGSLVRASELDLSLALFSTLTGWALPGQVVAVEMAAAGASLLLIGLAVGLTNARLLPLVVTLVPRLAGPGVARWKLFLAAHLIAVTSWIFTMRRVPSLPVEARLAYLVGFGTTLWGASLAATALGYAAAAALPPSVSLALVFLNPIYFLLLLVEETTRPSRVVALLAGAGLGPALHLANPDWGLLVAGLAAGTLAYGVERRWPPPPARTGGEPAGE